jgi:adenylate kinase
MRIAFIGPVGSGKSAQAQRLSGGLPFHNRSPRLSTGELVRAQIEAGTPVGGRIKGHHDAGEPVPDGTILDLLRPHVRPTGGWVLDDFPANLAQADALEAELERSAGTLHRVIGLQGLTEDELVSRVLGGRVRSRATGITYHLVHDPPPRSGDRLDPGPFERREDDAEPVLRRRIGAYRGEYDLLKKRYEKRGVFSAVDAGRPIDKVAEDVLDALGRPESDGYYAV